MLLKNLTRAGDWRVLGLLDDYPAKRGHQIQGVNVLGALEELVELAPRLGVERGIIALPSALHQSRRRALEICRRAGVEALTVPSYQDLVGGKVTVSQVRNIKLDDLLGRDPVLLDESRLQQWIHGRSILVTGAGGSIGSELCLPIARFEPAQLVLYEHNEFALYRMEQEFAEQHRQIGLNCVIGDVKNATRRDGILVSYASVAEKHHHCAGGQYANYRVATACGLMLTNEESAFARNAATRQCYQTLILLIPWLTSRRRARPGYAWRPRHSPPPAPARSPRRSSRSRPA